MALDTDIKDPANLLEGGNEIDPDTKGLMESISAGVATIAKLVTEGNIQPASGDAEAFYADPAVKDIHGKALNILFTLLAERLGFEAAINLVIDKAITAGPAEDAYYCKNSYDISRVRLVLHRLLLEAMTEALLKTRKAGEKA